MTGDRGPEKQEKIITIPNRENAKPDPVLKEKPIGNRDALRPLMKQVEDMPNGKFEEVAKEVFSTPATEAVAATGKSLKHSETREAYCARQLDALGIPSDRLSPLEVKFFSAFCGFIWRKGISKEPEITTLENTYLNALQRGGLSEEGARKRIIEVEEMAFNVLKTKL